MNSLAREWLQKAEGDFTAATALLELQNEMTADAICFHCQQCAEKYLKAYLQQHNLKFTRTHDLVELLLLCQQLDATFKQLAAPLQLLNNYSVEIRYPGRFTSLAEADSALGEARIVREFISVRLTPPKKFSPAGDDTNG